MKKILIIHPDGNINDNPNLSEFCNALFSYGFSVDVFSPLQKHIPYQFPAHCAANLYLTNDFSNLNALCFSDYSFIIGIDSGIIPAAYISKVLNVPYGFLSYEIIFDDELVKASQKIEKAKMKEACENISFSIVQDSVRGTFLSGEYLTQQKKMFYMPVAGAECIKYERSYYLHDNIGIPREKNILLFTGTFSDWSMIDRVVENADSMPDNWVLVIHSRYGDYDKTVDHKKVFYSRLQQSDIREMSKIIQSASCCLALYDPTYSGLTSGKNIKYIGLSSGKISMSLQHGIPVVVNEVGEISELINKNHAGFVLDINSTRPFERLSEFNDTQSFNEICHKIFADNLSIEKFAPPVISEIEKLALNVKSEINQSVIETNAGDLTLIELIGVFKKYLRGILGKK